MHLRIDSIEQALRNSGCNVEGEGYAVAYRGYGLSSTMRSWSTTESWPFS
jgi:hypothetical protein